MYCSNRSCIDQNLTYYLKIPQTKKNNVSSIDPNLKVTSKNYRYNYIII